MAGKIQIVGDGGATRACEQEREYPNGDFRLHRLRSLH
jgi:hypothetical protein